MIAALITCPRRIAAVALLAAALVAVPACQTGPDAGGYTTRPPFPEQFATVAVPIFDNRTFQQGVEFDLTEALIKEIELRTPYKVTPSSRADTMLVGTVLDVSRRTLSRTFEGGIPQEMQVVVSVSFEWKDLRTSQVIRKRSGISGTGEFIPTRTVGEPYEKAQHQAVAELARDIVSVMRDDW